ncbi:MAG: glycoside hydrolase family 5 protein [Thermoproteota archaeon]
MRIKSHIFSILFLTIMLTQCFNLSVILQSSPVYDFETDNQGWIGWDAITSATQTTEDAKVGIGSLKCFFDQSIKDDGKASVDFSSFKDLRGMRLSVWVKVPTSGFMIKIFAQDNDWTWLDASDVDSPPANMWAQVVWDLPNSTVGNFDPSRIRRVGVMFGRWGQPRWSGYVYMDAFDWYPTPPLPQTPLTPPPGMFRGINMGNALEAPREGDWGVIIKDEYFKIIREAGFDTVRIPIRWSAHALQNPPYTIDANFFNRVDHVINKALEQGLTTIINIHHYEEIMQDPQSHRERFLGLWRQISERYKDYPDKLYFELLNEPCQNLDAAIWNQLLQEALNVIRTTNPTRKVIIGPVSWNSIRQLKYLELPSDPNIIVTFHFYTPFEFTHQGAEWVNPPPPVGRTWNGTDEEKNQITSELNIAFQWAKERNLSLLMGEFGAYSKADMDSRVRWTSFVAREAEKRGIAWCYWEFCAGFGAYDPISNQWREPLLRALIPESPPEQLTLKPTEHLVESGVIKLRIKIASPKIILSAGYAVDTNTLLTPLNPVDGSWNSNIEFVEINFNASLYSDGLHVIYINANDTNGATAWLTLRFHVRSLARRYNLIALILKPPSGYSAEDLARAIGTSASLIAAWDNVNQIFKGYCPGVSPPEDNFPIEEGCGYFVYLTYQHRIVELEAWE